MTLEEVRNEIDEIDTNMKPLFLRRMKCGKHVAEVKGQTGGDVFAVSYTHLDVYKRQVQGCDQRSGQTETCKTCSI